jgi:hypothetical protein
MESVPKSFLATKLHSHSVITETRRDPNFSIVFGVVTISSAERWPGGGVALYFQYANYR